MVGPYRAWGLAGALDPMQRPCREDFSPSWQGSFDTTGGRNMPRPFNERKSLEQEMAELPGQIAAYWNELENGSSRPARRERLEWQIRERENRLADVRARLATTRAGG